METNTAKPVLCGYPCGMLQCPFDMGYPPKTSLHIDSLPYDNEHKVPFISLHSADADQDGALDRFKTKIVLSSNGRNMWLGPVLYTFSCKIDVNFFPFDEQVSLL